MSSAENLTQLSIKVANDSIRGQLWPWLGDNHLFVLWILLPSQPNGVVSSTVNLPNQCLLGRLSPLSS